MQLFGQRPRRSRHRDLPVRASLDLEIADAGPERLGQQILDAALEFRPGPGTHEAQREPGVEFEPIGDGQRTMFPCQLQCPLADRFRRHVALRLQAG